MNKLQWHFNQNTKLFIHGIAYILGKKACVINQSALCLLIGLISLIRYGDICGDGDAPIQVPYDIMTVLSPQWYFPHQNLARNLGILKRAREVEQWMKAFFDVAGPTNLRLFRIGGHKPRGINYYASAHYARVPFTPGGLWRVSSVTFINFGKDEWKFSTSVQILKYVIWT